MNTVDISKYRDDFPVLKTQMNGQHLAFLDSAASAQKPQAVIDAMNAVLEGGYSNIHRGLYAISQDLTAKFEESRKKIAKFIGEEAKNIIFTRNATESINLVAQSWGKSTLRAGDEIILSQMEHHANIVPWQILRDQIGMTLKIIPVLDDGTLDMGAYENLLSDRTRLVSIVQTSNALGTVNPINKIIELAKNFNKDIQVLVDGTQAVVHGPVHLPAIAPDFYVFTGHKLYGPTGIGVLYARPDLLEKMPPYQGGGDMIERVSFDKTTYKEAPEKFEAGTPAIVEAIGLGAAVDYLADISMDKIAQHEASLLSEATAAMSEIKGLTIHGNAPQKAGIISFTMDGAHPSDIGMILDQCGVAIRAGHHCCMPLMDRLGLDATARVSFGLYNNKNDIIQLVKGLHKVQKMFA